MDPGTALTLSVSVLVFSTTHARVGEFLGAFIVFTLLIILCTTCLIPSTYSSTFAIALTAAYEAWAALPDTTSADNTFSTIGALTIPGLDDKTILGLYFIVRNPTDPSKYNCKLDFTASTGTADGFGIGVS